MGNYKRGTNSYNFNKYNYNQIDYIYNNIKKNSRVIFIVRHAERGADYSKDGGLTKNGIKQAKSLGHRLSGGIFSNTKSDLYLSTLYKRTPETSFYVGYGRGYSFFKNDKKIFEQDWLNYDKIIHSVDIIYPSYLTFEMGFSELNKKSTYLVNYLCKYTQGHPFCFITSHDNLVIPLITWITEGVIKFTLNTRVNYMSGIAIIINDTTKTWECYPISTLKRQSMIEKNAGDFNGVTCSTRKKDK